MAQDIFTLYTTIYTTITAPVTTYIISHYRVTSEYTTQLIVDYYDEQGEYVTTIAYPTSYLKDVYTALVGVETRVVAEEGEEHKTEGKGGARRETIPAPT